MCFEYCFTYMAEQTGLFVPGDATFVKLFLLAFRSV